LRTVNDRARHTQYPSAAPTATGRILSAADRFTSPARTARRRIGRARSLFANRASARASGGDSPRASRA